MKAICPKCGSEEVEVGSGEITTLVGFFNPPGHDHDDNCITKRYKCRDCDHYWSHARRRKCPVEGCDFVTRETCWCFHGKAEFEYPEAKYKMENSSNSGLTIEGDPFSGENKELPCGEKFYDDLVNGE